MNVAVIFLDERPYKGEDPQIIFETLNSLGKPLTLADLVRNFILLTMDSEEQSDIYERIWHPQIEAVLSENTSHFFRNYLQYKTASSIKTVSDNNTKEIYQQFKDFVAKKFTTHADFINDIIRYVPLYKWIVVEINNDSISKDPAKDKEIKELIRNIFHDIKSEAFKPFVMGLLEYHQTNKDGDINLTDEKIISVLQTIRTYLIRRRILGLTQAENKNIVLLSNKIEDLSSSKITMIDLLSNMFYALRFPNDEEISVALKIMNFYELKAYSKFILGKIEENNTKVSVDFRNPIITIEHIMPQTLNETWRTELGADYESIHKKYLHNIGNIILTEFNSEIGNKPFTEKKEKFNTSSLNFRLDIISKNSWNESAIIEHQEKMVEWFLSTFPLPDAYKQKNNWNSKTSELDLIMERKTFSPLEDDAGDYAQGEKPSKFYINGNEIKVSTWQDVFIHFLKWIKDSNEYDFDVILDNQSELFTPKYNLIEKWSTLKLKIDEDSEFTMRYKTFDRKTWDKIENPSENEYFIHTNMSAYYCMKRIASVMNKFNIAEDVIKIALKK